MNLTEKDARGKRCPLPIWALHDQRTQNHCIASDCMAWRWSGDAPEIPTRKLWWPETEDDALLRSSEGPVRPSEAIGVPWIPVSGGEEDENWEGGYWQEPSDAHRARIDDAKASRLGFCGACGPAFTRPDRKDTL